MWVLFVALVFEIIEVLFDYRNKSIKKHVYGRCPFAFADVAKTQNELTLHLLRLHSEEKATQTIPPSTTNSVIQMQSFTKGKKNFLSLKHRVISEVPLSSDQTGLI